MVVADNPAGVSREEPRDRRSIPETGVSRRAVNTLKRILRLRQIARTSPVDLIDLVSRLREGATDDLRDLAKNEDSCAPG